MSKQTPKYIIIFLVLALVIYLIGSFVNREDLPSPNTNGTNATNTGTNTQASSTPDTTFVYTSEDYGFTLEMPTGWRDYTESTSTIDKGIKLQIINNNEVSSTDPYMNVPILIYPIEQWNKWVANDFEGYVTAAPIGPTLRGTNTEYAFATAPRYNFSYLRGFEVVEEIVKTLKGI